MAPATGLAHSPWQRLRTDLQFAIVCLFSAVGVLGVLPFALLRFASGERVVGSVDLAIVLALLLAGVHAWRGGNLARTGLAIALASTAGCVAIAWLIGLPGLFWSYPALVASYLLTDRRQALALSVLMIAGVALADAALTTDAMTAGFVASAVVVGAFAHVFAHRSERQRRQLESLATHDALTGAFNRRAMDNELALAVEAHRRHAAGFALLLLDLDAFKRINDRYGHEAGDRVLVQLTQVLQRHFRMLDRIYRMGGEEFVVLLSGVEPASLAMVGEAVRARVERELRHADEAITVSIGAALLHDGQTASQWLGCADAAMYRAKRKGRNRVEIEPELPVA